MDKDVINNIFSQLIKSYMVKCGTISEMKTTLSKMSQEEKNDSLSSLLNDAEREHYNHLSKALKGLEKNIPIHESYLTDGEHEGMEDMINSIIKDLKNQKNTLLDKMFPYERRIIEGYNHETKNNKPQVNIDEYAQDNTVSDDEWTTSIDVKLGNLEKQLIDNQVAHTNFTNDNLNSLNDYFHDGFRLLNSRLNNGRTWNRLNKNEQKEANSHLNKMEKDISDAINKTDGVPKKMKVFHSGTFDVSLGVGDKVKFKGFLSSSLQENVAKEWNGGKFDIRGNPVYTYQILINTGTKGVLANDDHQKVLTHHREEHELLLDKGLEGTIYSVDVENHIVTLVQD